MKVQKYAISLDTIPRITYKDLVDTDGKFIENYQKGLESQIKSAKAKKSLDIFKRFDDGTIIRSNVFVPIFARQFWPNGEEPMTARDYAIAFNEDSESFAGNYRDPAIVFRSEGVVTYSPNEYFGTELKKRLEDAKVKIGKHPLFVPLSALDIEEDEKSDYGLVYVIKDKSQIVEAPMFADDFVIKRFSRFDEETALPVPDENGDFYIYTNNSNVSRVYLDGDRILNAGVDYLAVTYVNGRVGSKIAEGGALNFEAQYKKYLEQRQLAEEHERAMRIMLGK